MIKKREVVIVLGRTGMGKSIWCRQFLKDKTRLFAYDPIMEINCNYLNTQKLITFAEALKAGEDKGRRNFRVGSYNVDDVPLLTSCAYEYGNCWLSLEEASVVFNAGTRSPDWIRDAIFLGRHRNMSLLVTAQRPTSIPVDLRSQASRIVCFSQHEKNDVGWLRNYFNDQVETISTLPELTCLDSDGRTVERYTIDPKEDDKKKLTKEPCYYKV